MVTTNRRAIGLMILFDQEEPWTLVTTLNSQSELHRLPHWDEKEFAVLPKLLGVSIKITSQVLVPLAQECGKEYFSFTPLYRPIHTSTINCHNSFLLFSEWVIMQYFYIASRTYQLASIIGFHIFHVTNSWPKHLFSNLNGVWWPWIGLFSYSFSACTDETYFCITRSQLKLPTCVSLGALVCAKEGKYAVVVRGSDHLHGSGVWW